MKKILIINTRGTFSFPASEKALTPSITGEEVLTRPGETKDQSRIRELFGTNLVYEVAL